MSDFWVDNKGIGGTPPGVPGSLPGKHAQHHIAGGTDVIPDATNTSSGLLSSENKQNYDDANIKKHEHTNKSIIDTITQTLINAWNSAYTHVSDAVRHITSAERSLWNSKETPTGAQAKADIAESKANEYTDIHDADTTKHITSEERTDWDDTSSKKHEHSNKTVLDTITELIINGWDSAVEHISDLVKHITSDERTKWNAVTNKADITYVDEELNNKAASVHGHVKADITDFPNLSNVATSGSYNDLSNKPTIPTDTNQLAKTDVYTKTEVDNKLGSAGYGDMMKAVYDTDEDGTVDKADIANTLKVSETKKITIEGGIGTIPDDAVNSPLSLVVKGRTWTNRAGTGDTSPQTVENLDSTKTYLLINSLGKNVTIDTVDTATPVKLTGATSYVFEWTEGKIALYEMSATEAALTEAVLGARYHYVDSTKSTLSGRIKKVGNNLFDKSKATKGRALDHSTGRTGVNASMAISDFTRIPFYTQCKLSNAGISRAYAFYDLNKKYISGNFGTNPTVSLPVNASFIRFEMNIENIDMVKLEPGTVATPYVPYSEENAYYTGTYRSLPNGVKDEVRVSEGKLIKRVSDYELLNGSETYVQRSDGDGFYNFSISNWATSRNVVPDASTSQDSIAIISSGQYRSFAVSANRLYIAIDFEALDTYSGKSVGASNVTDIKSYIADNPITLTYQLAEPIVTKIEPQVLTAKAGDTIMWIPDSNPEDTTTPEMEVEYVVDMGGAVNKLVDTAQHLNERAGMHTDDISELQIKTDAHDSDYIKHPIVGTTNGSSTAYTLSPDPPLDELVIGVGAIITAHLASGDNPTLNISGKGAKPILKPNDNPAKFVENGVYHVRYNGVNFILLGEGGLSLADKQLLVDVATEVDEHKADYEYQTPTISGTQIQLQKQSDTSILRFKLGADLSGGAITISLDDGTTEKPLVDVEGVAVTELSKGFVEVVDDAVNFTYAPKGASLKEVSEIIFSAESIDYGGIIWSITSDDNYLYVGGLSTQKVYKLNKSDLSKVTESIGYGGDISSITADDNYLYVGGATTRKVYKLNKSDLSKVTESIGYGGDIRSITADDNYLYVGGATTRKVYKLNKSDLSKVTESIGYGGTILSITADDNYLYVGGLSTQKVYKLNKSDLSKVTESIGYGGDISSITADDNYLYVGGATTQKVYKLNKSDLSKVTESIGYGGDIWSITADDNYLYVGGATTRKVYKLNKSDLSKVTESIGYGGTIWSITADDNYLYVGGATTQKVYRLHKVAYLYKNLKLVVIGSV